LIIYKYNSPQLLTETHKATISSVGKKFMIESNMMIPNKKTLNGRVYSEAVCDKCCTEVQDKIRRGQFFGMLGHTPSGSGGNVNPLQISHVVKSLRKTNEGIWRGKCEVIDEGCGKLLQSLIRAGASLGISSSGVL
jgi:hypothetical protein